MLDDDSLAFSVRPEEVKKGLSKQYILVIRKSHTWYSFICASDLSSDSSQLKVALVTYAS
jgi:hypothetical protein